MTEASSATSLLERCRDVIDRLAELSRSHGGWWLSLDMSMREVKAVFVLAVHGPVSVGGL